MFEYAKLPKVPEKALVELAQATIETISSYSTGKPVKIVLGMGSRQSNNLVIQLQIMKSQIVPRLKHEILRSLILQTLEIDDDTAVGELKQKLLSVIECVAALSMEDHFNDAQEEAEFDHAKLDKKGRGEIRDLLTEVRDLTLEASFLKAGQKRAINVRIQKIENELYRDEPRYAPFLSFAADVSSMSKTVGENLKPIADRVEQMRTKTQRTVSGYQQIEQDEAPKQIEDKSDE